MLSIEKKLSKLQCRCTFDIDSKKTLPLQIFSVLKKASFFFGMNILFNHKGTKWATQYGSVSTQASVYARKMGEGRGEDGNE